MKGASGMFSSDSAEWPTPAPLYATLHAEFGFTLDPCASAANAKCERFYDAAADGLFLPWTGNVFMNPPYGTTIGRWVAKARREAAAGAVVVCLLPARTDTAWWHQDVMPGAAQIRFICGRLSFGGGLQDAAKARSGAHNAPFPSVIVVFAPGSSGAPRCSSITRDGRPVPAEAPALFGRQYEAEREAS